MPTTRSTRWPADLPARALVSGSLAPISRIGSGLRFGSWVGSSMRPRRIGRVTVAASLGQAAWATRRRWRALPAEHRDRLQALLRQSAGVRRTCLRPSAANHGGLSAS